MFANCFCKLATVAVKEALLVVRVALLFTSAAKMSFSILAALDRGLKYLPSSATDSCGNYPSCAVSLSKASCAPKWSCPPWAVFLTFSAISAFRYIAFHLAHVLSAPGNYSQI